MLRRGARPVPQVPEDARGIVDPGAMARYATLTRYPAGDALDGIVDWFWAVRWWLPAGVVHVQEILTHPSTNLSVGVAAPLDGDLTAELHGVTRTRASRRLEGEGWTVAAKTTCGGLGALVAAPAYRFTDRVVPLGPALGRDDAPLVGRIADARADDPHAHADDPHARESARVDLLRCWLVDVLDAADPRRVAAAREVAAVARRAESDRTLRRVEDLAAVAGVTPRTLQRLFAEHAGVTPTWVVRRYRVLEVAEAARAGGAVPWTELAADLGYADQAHLARDFRAHFGRTPTGYARGLTRPVSPAPRPGP